MTDRRSDGPVFQTNTSRAGEAPGSRNRGTGVKHDAGKSPLHLLPTDALEEVAHVMSFGADKYGPRNWEAGMAWSRRYAAALRHLFAWWRGENADPETGLPHLAHAACCVLFLLAYSRRAAGADDRPVTERGEQ